MQVRPWHAARQAPGRGGIRGITISPHISKLKPTAFYGMATVVYERALGGPCLVGGMRGVSLKETLRTAHKKLDFGRLKRRVVDVLVKDHAKFFDIITQYVDPIMGA